MIPFGRARGSAAIRISSVVFRSVAATLFLSLALGNAAEESLPARIQIHLSQRFQIMDGFGVNFNGTYFRDAQKPMIDMLINDLGATIFRWDPYGLSNWEAVNDDNDPKHMNWEYYNDRYSIPAFEASWAAGRYLNSRGIQPFLALSGIAPEWMLDKNAPAPQHKMGAHAPDLSRPYHLNPAMYDEFAEEVVSLAVYARTKARIDFKYFGPVNETDCYPAEGPRIDPNEAPRALEAISNRLRQEGLGDVRLVVAEQCDLKNNYIGPILDSKELMSQVGAFGFHSYGDDPLTPQMERLNRSKYAQSVRVWLTEYGDLNDLDRSAANDWTGFSIAATTRALRAINQGASAALYWDAYDNYHEHYPRLTYYGLVQNADHIYSPKKRYYAAKQLYHFVRPGARRIASSGDSSNLLVSAFYDGARGEVILVGVKQGGPDRVEVHLAGSDEMPTRWELYQTTPQLNCVKTEEVGSKEGIVRVDIAGESIFTLVGKR
jgi:O-glycosyl hydrolase